MKFQEAVNLLSKGRMGKKKVGRNTYLHRTPSGNVAVKFHETDIVTIEPDNTYTLNSGGWRTSTTKARIKKFSPARLAQEKGLWYLYTGQGRVIFQDGIKVNSKGKPIKIERDNTAEIEGKKRKLDKMVRDYINGFAAYLLERGELQRPTDGDCWHCFTKNGGNVLDLKDSEPMGGQHLLMHFEEKYYVPSLLWKAIQSRGYNNPAFIWNMLDGDLRRSSVRMLKDILRAYFSKRKQMLLELM